MSAPLAVRAVHHVSLRVTDVARSRTFYEDFLGLATEPRPDLGFPGVWYGASGVQLHLVGAPKLLDGIDPTDPHLALEVDDLARVRAVLDTRGVPYRDFGGAQLWVVDPDGNVIELCERASTR